MTRITGLHFGFLALITLMAALILLLGQGPLSPWTDPLDRTILVHFRAPRVALAVLTGAALGAAGAAMQSLLRNPLASPDIIGPSAGAAAGAAAMIVFTGHTDLASLGAILGGTCTAAVILLFAWRSGVAALTLVLVGVATSLMLSALTDVLLSLSPGLQAAEVTRFLSGSFAASDWNKVTLMAATFISGTAILGFLTFSIERLMLGDETARALGIEPLRVRVICLGVAAVMVSVSVAVAGPIPFVAFLAGPIARKLAGRPDVLLMLAALIGAALALAADLLAQIEFAGNRLPAGVFTALIGGPAMLFILLMNMRNE
jgi:iron complex transport system permease protein